MNYNLNLTVQAVRESMTNLLELVEMAARREGLQELEELRGEAQQTVLMMIAAIALADEKYEAGERAFMNLLVDWGEKPGGDVRYLNEYAERWKSASRQVPRFFQVGSNHDVRNQTELTRAMIREMQLIGNNVCVSDGHFEASEHEVVRNYTLFLEDYFAVYRTRHCAPDKLNAEGWKNV